MEKNLTQKKEMAKQKIRQAVTLSELQLSFMEKQVSDVNPIKVMSQDLGLQLASLLQTEEGEMQMKDWDAEISTFEDALTQILLLFAKPGVLDMLPEAYRSDIANQVYKLKDYFKSLTLDQYVKEFLDYSVIDQYTQSEEDLDRAIKYYSFDKRNDGDYTYFLSYNLHADRLERMREVYPEVIKAV